MYKKPSLSLFSRNFSSSLEISHLLRPPIDFILLHKHFSSTFPTLLSEALPLPTIDQNFSSSQTPDRFHPSPQTFQQYLSNPATLRSTTLADDRSKYSIETTITLTLLLLLVNPTLIHLDMPAPTKRVKGKDAIAVQAKNRYKNAASLEYQTTLSPIKVSKVTPKTQDLYSTQFVNSWRYSIEWRI